MIKGRWPQEKKSRPPKRGMMEVLSFIESEAEAGRGFPTNGMIQRHMEWKNTTSVNDALMRLKSHGHIVVLSRENSGKGWRYKYALPAKEEV